MSRHIGLPIRVELDAGGLPVAFEWRGHVYHVRVIGRWHLRDRWWVSPAEANRTGKGASDRHYFRVQTADHQVFELFRETTSAGSWVLDRIQD